MGKKYRMYRCTFVKENDEYIIGKDIFNENTYHIEKNKASKGFKLGSDSSFYAIPKTVGRIFKKEVLEPIEYEKLVLNNEKNRSVII